MNEREQKLEALLGAALAQYGEAEPLSGLEERVLDRMHSAPQRRAWWMWGAVLAAVAAVVVAVVMTRPAEQKPAPVTVQQAPKQPPAVVTPPVAPVQAAQVPRRAAPRHVVPQQVAKAEPLPKRDVFPTPAPPDEQARLLVRYLRATPRAEVLAQINRQPLELQEDPLSAPSTNTNTSPSKSEGTR
jgi:hypothetical protein